jgi:hypothetical protein
MRTWEGIRWPDNTQWEFEAPDEWTVFIDKSIKNWPHKIIAPSGAVLTIWVGKHGSVQRAAWQPPLPDWLHSDVERKAYALGEIDAKHYGRSELRRREFGGLLGFDFELKQPDGGWDGYFLSEPWMVHAKFEPSAHPAEVEHAAAREILSSMRFKEVA